METFVSAYLLVWLAVSAYVIRLGVRQRQLQRDFESLKRQLDSSHNDPEHASEAA